MTTNELMIPTVHLNGTSKDALVEQLCAAIYSVHEAGRKLAAACPNGRDYYTQDGNAIGKALAQHEARMTKLRDVAAELTVIAESL